MLNNINRTSKENHSFASTSMLAIPADDDFNHDIGNNMSNQDELDNDKDPDWKELAILILEDEDISMDDLRAFEEGLREWSVKHKYLLGKSLFKDEEL